MKSLPILLSILCAISGSEKLFAEDFGKGWGEKSVENISGWIKEFDHVEAVVYNPSEKNPEEPPVLEGKLHKGVASAWTKRLTPEQTKGLISFITGKRKNSGDGSGCYLPHHGFIFYDKDSKIVGYLAICFMCGGYSSSPENGLSIPWDLAGIKKLTEELGLPTFQEGDEASDFFANRKKLERGPEKAEK